QANDEGSDEEGVRRESASSAHFSGHPRREATRIGDHFAAALNDAPNGGNRRRGRRGPALRTIRWTRSCCRSASDMPPPPAAASAGGGSLARSALHPFDSLVGDLDLFDGHGRTRRSGGGALQGQQPRPGRGGIKSGAIG